MRWCDDAMMRWCADARLFHNCFISIFVSFHLTFGRRFWIIDSVLLTEILIVTDEQALAKSSAETIIEISDVIRPDRSTG
jgi:hypothetical protein